MTCADARHRILTADLAALRGESDAALRAHLDGCATCAADARRIVIETRRLGVGIVAREWQPRIQRVNRRRTVMIVAPIAAAAVLTLIAVRPHRFAPVSPTSPPHGVVTGSRVEKVTISDGDTDMVSPARADAQRPGRPVATASGIPAKARPVSRRSVPVVTAGQTASSVFTEQPTADVSVTVGENQRAAIISTSNKNVTVVWLTRGQQP